jgi:Flp pilus assembly protein TadG
MSDGETPSEVPATTQVAATRRRLSFARDRKGVTAVEFGLVAIPFFWLMMGLAENGLIFNTQSNLDFALMEVQREIRTGRAQTEDMDAADLRTQICNRMSGIMGTAAECELRLHLDVRAFPSFEALDAPDLVDGAEIDEDAIQFDPGQPSEIVLVRALYEWQLLTPLISETMANFGNDTRLLASTALFVNEPYDDGED